MVDLHFKTSFHHTLLRKAVSLFLFFGMIVRDFDILQTNPFFAMVKHMSKLMEERKPHCRTFFKAVMQLD